METITCMYYISQCCACCHFVFWVKSWRVTSLDPGAVHYLDRQAKQLFSLDLYSPFLLGGICGCASPLSLNWHCCKLSPWPRKKELSPLCSQADMMTACSSSAETDTRRIAAPDSWLHLSLSRYVPGTCVFPLALASPYPVQWFPHRSRTERKNFFTGMGSL